MKYIKAGILLALMLFILFMPGYVAGTGNLLGGAAHDLGSSYFPWRTIGFSALRAGSLLFWNPYVLCGTPFAANPETALFYPPNWLFLLVEPAAGITVSILAHLFLCGIFTFTLLGFLGCSFWPAFLGGLVYMIGGNTIPRVFAGHLSNICTMAWLPALILAIELLFQRVSGRRIAFGALLFGIFILAGHFQYVFYISLFLLVYSLLRLPNVEKPMSSIAAFALVVILGVGLSAVQLSLTGEMLGESARKSLSEAFCATFSWDPANVWTFLMPDYFLIHPDLGYWGKWCPWEMNAFVGILPLLLSIYYVLKEFLQLFSRASAGNALPGAFDLPCRGVPRAFVGSSIVFLVLSLGGYTPLFTYLYAYVPWFNMFRGSCKFLIPVFFCASALAAFGFERLLHESRRGKKAEMLLFFGIGGILLGIASLQIFHMTENHAENWVLHVRKNIMEPGNMGIPGSIVAPDARANIIHHFHVQMIRLAWFCILSLIVLFLCLKNAKFAPLLMGITLLDLGGAVAGFLPWQQTAALKLPPLSDADMNAVREGYRIGISPAFRSPNSAMLDHLSTPMGYESNPPMRIANLYAGLNGMTSGYQPVYAVPFDTFSAHLVSMKFAQEAGKTRSFPDCPPRARFYPSARFASSPEEILAAVRSRDPYLTDGIYILASSPDKAWGRRSEADATPGQEKPEICVVDQNPDCIRFSATLPRDGWFYLNDTFARGWSVTVDQTPQPIRQANYAFRAVAVASGTHEIIFRYAPPGFTRGLLVTLTALLAIASLAITSRRARRSGFALPAADEPGGGE